MLKSMNLPLITIIIPFYNRVNFTIRALESALFQSYDNTEIILINDGSTESLSELSNIVDKSSRCTLISSKNGGPASARNIGLNHAKGSYVAFLDSDDYWEPDKLATQLKIMLDNKWNFSFTSYYIKNLETSEKVTRSCKIDYKFPIPAFHCDIATPTVMVEMNLIKNLRFNESFRAGEDTLFWLNLSKITTLRKINLPLATVTTSNTTTFKNKNLKLQTFELLNKDGLNNHFFLQLIHNLYVFLRKSFNLI